MRLSRQCNCQKHERRNLDDLDVTIKVYLRARLHRWLKRTTATRPDADMMNDVDSGPGLHCLRNGANFENLGICSTCYRRCSCSCTPPTSFLFGVESAAHSASYCASLSSHRCAVRVVAWAEASNISAFPLILRLSQDACKHALCERCRHAYGDPDISLPLPESPTLGPETNCAHFIPRGPRAYPPLPQLRVFPHCRRAAGLHVAMGAGAALGACQSG
jgi:hypothetical protein